MLPLLLKICHFSVVIHKIVSQIFDHSLISFYHLVTLSLIFLTLTASSALSSLFLLCPSSSSTTASASSVFISSNHFALRRQTDHFHLSDQNKNVDAQISGSNSCCSVKHCTTWGRCPSQVDEHKGLPFLPEVLPCRWKTSGFWETFDEVFISRIYHENI